MVPCLTAEVQHQTELSDLHGEFATAVAPATSPSAANPVRVSAIF
jgi:hypothetical protein